MQSERGKREEGAVLVEAVVCLVLFLVLITAVCGFGVQFQRQVLLDDIIRVVGRTMTRVTPPPASGQPIDVSQLQSVANAMGQVFLTDSGIEDQLTVQVLDCDDGATDPCAGDVPNPSFAGGLTDQRRIQLIFTLTPEGNTAFSLYRRPVTSTLHTVLSGCFSFVGGVCP